MDSTDEDIEFQESSISSKKFKVDKKSDINETQIVELEKDLKKGNTLSLKLDNKDLFLKTANKIGKIQKKNSKNPKFNQLNVEQKTIYNYIENCLDEKLVPFHLLVPGKAGSGKSYLLSVICQMLDAKKIGYKVMSYTGISAFNVGGETFHYSLKIPYKKSFKEPHNVSKDLCNELRNVKVFIFDEFSLIGLSMLGFISQRLMSVYDSTDEFGGKSVVLFGDYAQLRPILDVPLHNLGSGLSQVQAQGRAAYAKFKKALFLRQIMRQSDTDGGVFKELLSRVRIGEITKEDVTLLETRNPDRLTPEEAVAFAERGVHLFADRRPCVAYNEFRLNCLGVKIYEIPSIDTGFMKPSERHVLRLAVGARICVTRNLFIKAGVYNGALGYVTSISEEIDEEGFPKFIMIKLDYYVGPTYYLRNDIPIAKCSSPASEYGATWTRKQFPLMLAYGLTIHKAQGTTLDKVVIAIPENNNSNFYRMAPAIFYTALSRAKRLEDVLFSGFFKEYLVNGHNNNITNRQWKDEEKRLEELDRES